MARTKKNTRVLPTDVKQNIIEASYSDIMSKSYVDYALSVIIARAVPDIRDGLKPVQRRVIYDMYELGTTSDKPYRKSARIVGDTMGKYHPHGDSSIYESLVVMSQDFKNRSRLWTVTETSVQSKETARLPCVTQKPVYRNLLKIQC